MLREGLQPSRLAATIARADAKAPDYKSGASLRITNPARAQERQIRHELEK